MRSGWIDASETELTIEGWPEPLTPRYAVRGFGLASHVAGDCGVSQSFSGTVGSSSECAQGSRITVRYTGTVRRRCVFETQWKLGPGFLLHASNEMREGATIRLDLSYASSRSTSLGKQAVHGRCHRHLDEPHPRDIPCRRQLYHAIEL